MLLIKLNLIGSIGGSLGMFFGFSISASAFYFMEKCITIKNKSAFNNLTLEIHENLTEEKLTRINNKGIDVKEKIRGLPVTKWDGEELEELRKMRVHLTYFFCCLHTFLWLLSLYNSTTSCTD